MKEYSKMANALFDYRTPFELKVKNRYPGARIAVFDVNRLMEDMYGDPKRYFGDGANVTGQFAVGAKRNGELENFMWYDELHPSGEFVFLFLFFSFFFLLLLFSGGVLGKGRCGAEGCGCRGFGRGSCLDLRLVVLSMRLC